MNLAFSEADEVKTDAASFSSVVLPEHYWDGLGAPDLPRVWSRPLLLRLRYQLPLVLLVTAVFPAVALRLPAFWELTSGRSESNTFLLVSACAMIALALFRRLEQFPGISSFAQIAPSVAGAYGLVLVSVVGARINYSRPLLAASAASCLLLLGALWFYYRRRCRPTVYLLPGATCASCERLRLHRLQKPTTELGPNAIVAADLHSDLAPQWQRFILNAALAGIPVYDAKTLQESTTGKVEISHLSENTLGSVLPSLPYLRIKRVVDVALAAFALPVLMIPMCVVALAIRLDSRGPVLFRQMRVGFRGKLFVVLKFRTMRLGGDGDCPIESAKTKDGDVRITRVGRFLRHHRIDELPQIFNILRGEMSWIGPRPEAEALAHFYARQIPFYAYRHLVRPGVSGWAQVNQGHVVEVDAIGEKLNYDFFYIKHFSAWLDALIAARTIKILLFGKGSR